MSHAGKASGIVAAVGYAEPMLRVLTTGFGFDGIAGSLGIVGAGEPLGMLLLGGTIDLLMRSRRSALYGLPLGRFTEPWLPTGSIACRIVERHER